VNFSACEEVIVGFEHIDYSEKFRFLGRIIALGGVEKTRVKDCWF
jgi:hypothetical protein